MFVSRCKNFTSCASDLSLSLLFAVEYIFSFQVFICKMFLSCNFPLTIIYCFFKDFKDK